uniref:Uncharacterized protein n=1 Tax=Pseudo-nitzschia australis TaxID=44445 RepID=A0A7S4A9L8_9STRA|mmetsp:Transcript_685/g.1585  ORF Transcript_685/g.1585 Transcript_685/m.1585 type:complete len:257 (+) Transcript_685:251-1021(+)|eukprot:CAMPEP_0168191688 /NCGR_PEP_ID=MMETSP0139_2-20121125/17652_1 /TAXON_ID=44445 /ORGANISM="Pseudo-nitzschia australis, Strain 10249 10 AB" /LENGTH=256 /DNA_ID=CAMNT_0008114885 /DNA_START=183 /DNA_END=953 /DNA_ORIENTATION=+
MRSIQKEQQRLRSLFFLAILLTPGILGFQSPSSPTKTRSTSHQQSRLYAAIIDPVGITTILTAAQQTAAGDLPISPLSAILATTVDFGSIQSIHPAATTAATAATETIQQMLPGAGEALQGQVQEALNSGMNVMDASKFAHGGGASLPGFAETNSILAPHVTRYPQSGTITPDNFPQFELGDRLAYAYLLLEYVQKLPYVAFAYVLVEFFFLRSNVDLYKEDIEDDPSGVLAETVSDTGVRVGLFLVLAVITYVIF